MCVCVGGPLTQIAHEAARARAPLGGGSRAVARQHLDRRQRRGGVVHGVLRLTKFDGHNCRIIGRGVYDGRTRGQRLLLYRRDFDANLGQSLGRRLRRGRAVRDDLVLLLRQTMERRQADERARVEVAVGLLQVVVEVAVDELERHDATGEDHRVAVRHIAADVLPDNLLRVHDQEVPLDRREQQRSAAQPGQLVEETALERAQKLGVAPLASSNVAHLEHVAYVLARRRKPFIGHRTPVHPQVGRGRVGLLVDANAMSLRPGAHERCAVRFAPTPATPRDRHKHHRCCPGQREECRSSCASHAVYPVPSR